MSAARLDLSGMRVALIATIVLTACSASPGVSDDAATPDAPAEPAGAPAQSAPVRLGTLSKEDEALTAELTANGYSEGAAAFLAMTNVEVESRGEYSQRIVYAFPTGNTAEISVTLVPDGTRAAQRTDALTMTSSEPNGDFAFEMEYFVPYDAMPADVREEVRSGTADADTRLAVAGPLAMSGPVAASDGVGVVVKAFVTKLQDGRAAEFLKFLDKQLGTTGALDTLYKQIKAGLAMKDALAMGAEHDELQRQLNALEECARNPTNPITKRAYRDDPGYRDRILEQIDSVRQEVKANTAVMFIAKLNQTASALLSKQVKWLSFVVGPATAWSRAALQEVNARLIEDLKKNITECGEGYQFEFGGTGTGFDLGHPVPVEWQYWGLLCEGSTEWRIWEDFDGVQGGSTTGPPSNSASVPYLVTFDEEGSMTGVSWDILGGSVPTTASGNTFGLSPGDSPTTVTAQLNAGAGVDMITVTAPVEPADGTIAECDDSVGAED